MLFLHQYFLVFIYLIICSLISLVFFLISYVISPRKEDSEKLSAYECGFDPFDDARATFDVRFYLVAILFIIFDLEITFLFPWCISLGHLSAQSFWVMFLFLVILSVGFLYEWKKGSLDWE